MFASRSELTVRAKAQPWVAAMSFLLLIAAALFLVTPPAEGQSSRKSRTKAVVDSVVDDEGISVRVVEGGKTRVVKRIRGADAPDTPDEPDAPDTPEPPEPPEVGDNDLVRFGQDITIEEGRVVDGSVVAIGGDIVVRGEVRGDVTAVGGSVSIEDSGLVHKDAVSVGGKTTVSDGGRVLGSDVSVGGGYPFRKHGGAGFIPVLGLMGFGALAGVIGTIVQLLITIFLAWLALLLIRERLLYAVERMTTHFGKSLLWGLVAWMGVIVVIPALVIVGAIAMVILVITIIGIPIAILLAIALVFALIGTVLGIILLVFLGYVNGAMYLGRLVLQRRTPGVVVSPMRAAVVGMVLMLGLKLLSNLIGVLGVVFVMPVGIALGIAAAILSVVLTTAGMGAMVLTRFVKGPYTFQAAPAVPAAPATPPAQGWYSPPPPPAATPAPAPSPPPSTPPPEPGSSDAP